MTCPGAQSVRTYTVGYGDNSAMLQSIALAGKGKFYRANNGTELRNSIIDALGDLKQLSTSFASASISGVQTGGMQSSVYVPRFVPRKGRPYEGHLFRFFYLQRVRPGLRAGPGQDHGGRPRGPQPRQGLRRHVLPRQARGLRGRRAGHLQLHHLQHRPGEHRRVSG